MSGGDNSYLKQLQFSVPSVIVEEVHSRCRSPRLRQIWFENRWWRRLPRGKNSLLFLVSLLQLPAASFTILLSLPFPSRSKLHFFPGLTPMRVFSFLALMAILTVWHRGCASLNLCMCVYTCICKQTLGWIIQKSLNIYPFLTYKNSNFLQSNHVTWKLYLGLSLHISIIQIYSLPQRYKLISSPTNVLLHIL